MRSCVIAVLALAFCMVVISWIILPFVVVAAFAVPLFLCFGRGSWVVVCNGV